MSYNKYNTRNSGRFNNSGQFVPANDGNYGNNTGPPSTLYKENNDTPEKQPQNTEYESSFQSAPQPPLPPTTAPAAPQSSDIVIKMDPQMDTYCDEAPPRPAWMKSRLQGVKKISNKERRRRQNENLRRLLSPKSALMVLNEIMPGEQVANQFKVEAVTNVCGGQYYRANAQSFCADLSLQGSNYKGYGDNKLTARNAAAEQAVRDLILRRMSRVLLNESQDGSESQNGEGEEEPLPMIQLASFALHKLFSEWEYDGHKVPQLKPGYHSSYWEVSEAADGGTCVLLPRTKPVKKKELPENASSMHPCMLLTYMRPMLEYRELAVEGDRPQNMLFTIGVDVDGTTYQGKASNKKEARKAASKAACAALFDVHFDES